MEGLLKHAVVEEALVALCVTQSLLLRAEGDALVKSWVEAAVSFGLRF